MNAWITGRAAEIDEVAKHLVASEVPRWPLSHTGRRSEQPLPNLLGHMKLGRVLAVSALEAESRGDHQRAWMLENAAWKLTQGLEQRPELISQLIAIANVRMIAATARKLEAPVPSWFREVAALHPRDGVYDALRFETTTTRLAMKGSPRDILLDSDGTSLPERAGEIVLAPVLRWAAADVTAAAAAEFQSMRSGNPCALDAKVANDRVRARTSPLARRFANAMMPNVGSAFVRAANVELAIEGTEKVLALKTARQSMGLWPQELPVARSSVCSGNEWSYTTTGESARLKFTGRVPEPPGFNGPRVPAEYVAR